jgi:menaquinone-dependent protoporphyrinogen oxidase
MSGDAVSQDDVSPASVLVAYATRFGSTRGVAERIAGRLRDRGLRAEARAVDDADGAGDHDAVVFGSPVFDGRWTPEAEAFVHREREALAGRPVWLFSVGTFGDRKRLVGGLMRREPKGIDEIAAAVHPREYRVFAGVIERRRWAPAARLLYHAFGGRFGDRRDWPDIEAWADAIATALMSPSPDRPFGELQMAGRPGAAKLWRTAKERP